MFHTSTQQADTANADRIAHQAARARVRELCTRFPIN